MASKDLPLVREWSFSNIFSVMCWEANKTAGTPEAFEDGGR